MDARDRRRGRNATLHGLLHGSLSCAPLFPSSTNLPLVVTVSSPVSICRFLGSQSLGVHKKLSRPLCLILRTSAIAQRSSSNPQRTLRSLPIRDTGLSRSAKRRGPGLASDKETRAHVNRWRVGRSLSQSKASTIDMRRRLKGARLGPGLKMAVFRLS